MLNYGDRGLANARLDDDFSGWIFGSQKPQKNKLNELSTDKWRHYQVTMAMGTTK